VHRLAVLIAVIVLLVGCSRGDDDDTTGPVRDNARSLECQWPMWGHDAARPFAYPASCETELAPDTVGRLQQRWFHQTGDVVTATPALVDGTIYVGDWSGTFYALGLADGRERWTYQAPEHENVYSGQIVGSAAVADVGGERLVYFPSGKTMYALDATDGTLRWEHELNPAGPDDDPTEIQSSPVVVDGMVIFGFDAHDQPGVRAGIVALDAASGEQRWYFDPDEGQEPSGCVGIWSSPSVDAERRLVFAGSANCTTAPDGWRDYSEAIFAIDLDTGEPRWHFQPRGPSNFDFDFAGAPNLFAIDGQAVVGLGGKDGVYYALDRESGDLVWKVEASIPRVQSPNFSTGGFIGPTAVAGGVVVGGTAVDGPCPCLHGIDTATGTLAWQQNAAAPTFAASTIVNGVAFAGSTTDFTLRALDLGDGNVLWSQQMAGGVAGGVAIVDDWVIAVAGIREPGLDPAGTESGVYGFTLGAESDVTTTLPLTAETLPPTTVAPPEDPAFRAPAEGATCVASACTLDFTLKDPPAGTNPAIALRLSPDPYRVEVRADDLGDPAGWIRPGGVAAEQGAVAYGVFVSDDSLNGALLCVLDGAFDCVSEDVPAGASSQYNRVTILAIADTPVLPSPTEGFDRIVSTIALDEALELE
jgi:polyvinyl alcohol dehydrogenase (cytochrome)